MSVHEHLLSEVRQVGPLALPAQSPAARHSTQRCRVTPVSKTGRDGSWQSALLAQARAGDRALVDGELLAQDQHLDLEAEVGPERRGEEPEQEREKEPHGGVP